MEQIVTIALPVLTTTVGVGISWGVMKGKISQLEKSLENHGEEISEIKDKYTPLRHFEAITRPLQGQINEIQHDIKKILMLLSKGKSNGI